MTDVGDDEHPNALEFVDHFSIDLEELSAAHQGTLPRQFG
jgi:phosphoribosylformylglycinamidine synthase